MCDPTTIAVLAVVSAGAQAYQGFASAQGIEAESNANAAIARSNAEYSRVAAQDANQRGANDAAAIRQNVRSANAQLNAEAGGAGLVSNTGSLLDFFGQNRQMGELDALTSVNNAEREAYGYKVQAAQGDANAANTLSLGRYNASSARIGGITSAAGTLLTGFGNASTAASNQGGSLSGQLGYYRNRVLGSGTTRLSNGNTIAWS